MLDLTRGLLLVVHLGASAAWLGAMLYSLVVIRPRVREFFSDPDEREDFVVALATDARWKVLALAATLALSGAGLIGVAVAEVDDPGATWIVLVALKAALLAASVALFAYLSWRLWPARFLAHVGGLPTLDWASAPVRPARARPRRFGRRELRPWRRGELSFAEVGSSGPDMSGPRRP